jgi:hypothetical protein
MPQGRTNQDLAPALCGQGSRSGNLLGRDLLQFLRTGTDDDNVLRRTGCASILAVPSTTPVLDLMQPLATDRLADATLDIFTHVAVATLDRSPPSPTASLTRRSSSSTASPWRRSTARHHH